MPPGRKGARNKKTREASVVPQSPPAPPPPPSPPQHSKPLSMPAPAARLSRTTRTSSKDIQPRGHLPARQAEEQKQRGVTPQRPVEPIPVDVLDVAERVEDVESEESEEDEGGVELIDETEWDSFNTRSMSASTSGTQLEADALDPTLAIEAIPALHRKSQDILEFLLASKPAQLLKKVRQPGSSAGKRLEMTTRDFSVTKDLFAASTEFIKVNVVNQLLDTDIFAPLICKANFAALALGLVRTIGLSNEAVQYLMGLENYFPGAFFPSPGDWEEGVRAQVNRLMLEIRTQLFIAAVYYEQAMPFDELLRQIFLEQEPDLESNEDDELHEAWAMGCKPKGWDLLTKEERRNCKSRINRIRSAYIVVDGGDDRLEPLDTEYLVQHWPWDKFVEDMMKFIAQRTAAINADSNFADLLDTAEQARKRGLESQEEDEDGLDNESISVVADTDAANDSNWLTDQSRTLVDAEVMGEGQAEGSANNRRRPSGDRLSSSAQLKFLKRQKMLLEAPNSPPAIKKASSQKPKIITSKAGMKALKSLAQSSANEAVAPAAPSARPPPPPPPPPAATQGKAGSRARATTNLPISVEQTNASAVNEPPNFDAGIDDIPIPAGTADQVALFKKLNAKRDKENRGAPPPKRSIYERQADAQKLSFNEDEELKETQSGDERAKARGQRGSKRSRDEVEDQAEEDPYAHDDRPEDPLRKKRSRVNPPAAPATRKKPPTDPRPAVVPLAQVARPERRRQLPAEFAPPPVRQQPVQGNELVPHRSRQTTPEAASRAVRRQRSGSALAPVPSRNLARRRSHDDLPQEIHGELTGERIRYLAASNRQRAIAKRPQVRQAWSQDEEDKLVEMVGLLGCRWAMIEHAASDVFAARGQVALKDKARNMKFSLLKSRLPLPPNFEHVTMGRRLLQELEQMGIDPNPPRAIQEAEYESTDSESEEEHRVIDRQHLARIREGREEA